jgi:hypothetical protein
MSFLYFSQDLANVSTVPIALVAANRVFVSDSTCRGKGLCKTLAS